MAAPNIWDPVNDLICPFLTPISQTLKPICFPGGLCLETLISPDDYPRVSDMVMAQLAQIGPAMAPMKPFFDVLDTALAIFRCIEAIPDAITSLDPSGLIECVPDLADKISQLLSLHPMLTIPRLIIALLHNLAAFLRAVANDIEYLRQRLARMATAADRAADLNDVTWGGFLQCAEQTVRDEMDALSLALQGIGRIILLSNILLSLIAGAPEIPCFGTLLQDVTVIDDVIAAIQALAALLEKLASMIPDPQLAITLALQGQRC